MKYPFGPPRPLGTVADQRFNMVTILTMIFNPLEALDEFPIEEVDFERDFLDLLDLYHPAPLTPDPRKYFLDMVEEAKALSQALDDREDDEEGQELWDTWYDRMWSLFDDRWDEPLAVCNLAEWSNERRFFAWAEHHGNVVWCGGEHIDQRFKGSPWQNPFHRLPDRRERLLRYEVHLRAMPELEARLQALGGKVLCLHRDGEPDEADLILQLFNELQTEGKVGAWEADQKLQAWLEGQRQLAERLAAVPAANEQQLDWLEVQQ
jgi:hypothetical protein